MSLWRAFPRGALIFAGLSGGMLAQGVRRTPRPAVDRVTRDGCPAAVPPVASDSGATATDFAELWRKACGGGCAAYRVRVGGDGRVSWVGEERVETMGAAAGAIDTIEARALIQRAADRVALGALRAVLSGWGGGFDCRDDAFDCGPSQDGRGHGEWGSRLAESFRCGCGSDGGYASVAAWQAGGGDVWRGSADGRFGCAEEWGDAVDAGGGGAGYKGVGGDAGG